MGFSRQEYWSGLPFPSPGDLPDPGIEPRFPALEADTLTSEQGFVFRVAQILGDTHFASLPMFFSSHESLQLFFN